MNYMNLQRIIIELSNELGVITRDRVIYLESKLYNLEDKLNRLEEDQKKIIEYFEIKNKPLEIIDND